MTWEPIELLVKKVQNSQLSATELVNKSLKLIEEKSDYHAILSVQKAEL